MKNVSILRVQRDLMASDRVVIALEVTDDATPGVVDMRGYCVPTDVLEWRVAEYDADPADKRALVEDLVYEAFVQEDTTPDNNPLTAETLEVAKTGRRDRLDRVKREVRLDVSRKVDAGGVQSLRAEGKGDALDDIASTLDLDEEIIAKKRVLVNKHRELEKMRRDPMVPTPTVADRATILDRRIKHAEKEMRVAKHGRLNHSSGAEEAR